jgi:hypothetical protein
MNNLSFTLLTNNASAAIINPATDITGNLGFWLGYAGYSSSNLLDQGPSSNTLAPASGLSMPSQVATQINGKSILRLSDSPIRLTNNVLTKGSGYSFYIVCKVRSFGTGNCIALSTDYSANPNIGSQLPFFNYSVAEGGWEFVAKTTTDFTSYYATIAQDTTAYHSILMTATGTTGIGNCQIYYDGASQTLNSLASPGYIVPPAVVGGAEFPTGTVFTACSLNADVAVIAVWDHQLSGAERSLLYTWQSHTFGL